MGCRTEILFLTLVSSYYCQMSRYNISFSFSMFIADKINEREMMGIMGDKTFFKR